MNIERSKRCEKFWVQVTPFGFVYGGLARFSMGLGHWQAFASGRERRIEAVRSYHGHVPELEFDVRGHVAH